MLGRTGAPAKIARPHRPEDVDSSATLSYVWDLFMVSRNIYKFTWAMSTKSSLAWGLCTP